MAFAVVVERDSRIEDLDYRMGLEPLLCAPGVEVSFLEDPGAEIDPGDLRGADAFVSVKSALTGDSIADADRLRVVARTGAGFDNLDLDALTERGVVAVHAPQGPTESVAQYTLGALVACAHGLPGHDRRLRERGFADRLANMGFELGGKRLGLVGVGLIGARVIEVVEPLGMDVVVHDPYVADERVEELGVRRAGLDELLSTSELVSLHVPLTEETRGMLGEAEFRRMPDSAYLINTTRGGIYRDAVLARAVREGWIAGAAVDVFEDEPHVEDNPLLDLEDCLVTPHVAGLTRDSLDRIGAICSESILAVKEGSIPRNVLNPGALDRPVPDERLSPSYR